MAPDVKHRPWLNKYERNDLFKLLMASHTVCCASYKKDRCISMLPKFVVEMSLDCGPGLPRTHQQKLTHPGCDADNRFVRDMNDARIPA
jgi:hypothetical protein